MNNKYKQAEKAREKAEQKMALIKKDLKEIKENLAEYYELVRWEDLDCSEEEYEKLHENLCYPYEENNIDYFLEM